MVRACRCAGEIESTATHASLTGASQALNGSLTVTGSWGGSVSMRAALGPGETRVDATLAAKGPRLWWARGMGPQALYEVTASFTPDHDAHGSRLRQRAAEGPTGVHADHGPVGTAAATPRDTPEAAAGGATGGAETGASVGTTFGTPGGAPDVATHSGPATAPAPPASPGLSPPPTAPAPLTTSTTRRIGFRHIALVTINDTDAAVVRAARARGLEGNGDFTLMLRLNGAAVHGRGANMVPMETLEGRLTPGMHRRVVQSAAEGGMNLLRLWGGGVFPYEEWLDACDEFGVLSIVDMQYAGVPTSASAGQAAEMRDNVRRLAHHPSVAMYTGCNECDGAGSIHNVTPPVLDGFVMSVVASEDDSRPIRAASPFGGYCTGVDRLTGLPNGGVLTSDDWPACLRKKGSSNRRNDRDHDHSNNHDHSHSVVRDDNAAAANNGNDNANGTGNTDDTTGTTDDTDSGDISSKGGTNNSRNHANVTDSPNNDTSAASSLPVLPPLPGGARELHGPYAGGGGWGMANGYGTPNGAPFGPRLLAQVPSTLAAQLGPGQPGYMRTETGCTAMSSFESMSATLPEDEWGLEAVSMRDRNYPCHSHINSYFIDSSTGARMDLSGVGEKPFKKQLYLCMLAQAFERKAWIEAWRSANAWALLMWQLNEIWPTGGWGSLEYGTPVPGQVLGGRWKILHSFMRQSSFVDVFVSCGLAAASSAASAQVINASVVAAAGALCYLRNDLPRPFSGAVQVSLVEYATGQRRPLAAFNATLGPGGAALFCPNGTGLLGRASPGHGTARRSCGTFGDLVASAGSGTGAGVGRAATSTPAWRRTPAPHVALGWPLLRTGAWVAMADPRQRETRTIRNSPLAPRPARTTRSRLPAKRLARDPHTCPTTSASCTALERARRRRCCAGTTFSCSPPRSRSRCSPSN